MHIIMGQFAKFDNTPGSPKSNGKMSKNTTGQKRGRNGPVEAPSPEELELPKRRRLSSCTNRPVTAWSTAEVVDSLRDRGIPEALLQSLYENAIEGRHLAKLNVEDLTRMGIRAVGSQKDILEAVESIYTQSAQKKEEEKIFNDPIHGHIELHPLMVKIIDTPQFQRLRYIKQLGGGYHVFPGASHNRFEHSIGVGYLAGELVETLQRKQPELDITDKDVLCVKIAGLCHDLGHGPFSHMFDALFIPKVLPDTTWKHEEASVMMFQHLITENGLVVEMGQYGLDDTDIVFIKEQIAGPLQSELASQRFSDWPYDGRPEHKSFLYEIVANKRNGIDVDKWDYFARDCHSLGLPNNFDIKRYMKFARVIHVNEERKQICTRDKEVSNLYEMFHTRSTLHRRVYRHKTANIVDLMVTEALIEANDHLMIPGQDNKLLKMSEAIRDPYAYTKLTDHVVQHILFSTDPNLKQARDILERIERRQLYKCIGQTQPATSTVLTKDYIAKISSEMIGCLTVKDLDGLPTLQEEDMIVEVVTFDYGMGDENPIDHMRFYLKNNLQKAVKVRKDQVSQMLPQTFREQHIRVYCRKLDKESLQSAWRYFITWCMRQDCITPEGGALSMDSPDIGPDEVTPYNTPFGTPVKQGPSPERLQKPSPLRQADIVKKLSFPQ